MTKHLKLTIKNTQIAEAINLGSLKDKLAKKKEVAESQPKQPTSKASSKAEKEESVATAKKEETPKKEDAPRIRARSKSVFAESATGTAEQLTSPETIEDIVETTIPEISEEDKKESELPLKKKTGEELRREIFGEDAVISVETPSIPSLAPLEEIESAIETTVPEKEAESTPKVEAKVEKASIKPTPLKEFESMPIRPERQKLGPTGRHIKDLLPPPKKVEPSTPAAVIESKEEKKALEDADAKAKAKNKLKGVAPVTPFVEDEDAKVKKGAKTPATKEFRDIKPTRRTDQPSKPFNVRDRQGLKDSEEDQRWRKKRSKARPAEEPVTIRPTALTIRTPISIKDLASEMKLKASQLISKLFLQGVIVTLNDQIDDETTIQLLGQEFGCEITIDTTEERRIRITDKSVKEEILASDPATIIPRAPVVAFMGHVDHGKTSLIDAIRKSNRVAGEAGAITQHIGAFRCSTAIGDITILDTPGHEAFSAMRARGAEVTDIVVLVIAGDEGIRQQTIEAIHHAKVANVTLVIAINKSDKPNYNPENVYRQLADQGFLPEVWGGQTLTVNCSAVTGAGINELLETLALQAEILELKANPSMRARGTVLESEMHKGMGSVATVLVQNGTLKLGDALVFDQFWGRVKTMQDELGHELVEAPPSTPVAITGLSGLPEAGQEFIVVKNEREAREIGEARMQGMRQSALQQKKKLTVENLFQQATPTTKKILNIVLRADVQGSLEALKAALEKIESTKAEINIIFAGVGEVSESDIQLASTSKAIVVGFHTQIESHAETLVKQLNIQVRLHDIIYHVIDDVKVIMKGLLDKIALETEKGKAEVRALFKSSQVGTIAGCSVIDGTILRNHFVRVMREGEQVGKTQISSLKRVKEDVREVSKGMECGIVLNKFEVQVGDILEAYEVTYITQEL